MRRFDERGRVRFALGLSLILHLGFAALIMRPTDSQGPRAEELWRGSIEIEIVDVGAQIQEADSPHRNLQVKQFVQKIQEELDEKWSVAESPSSQEATPELSTASTSVEKNAVSNTSASGGEGGTLSPQEATAAEIYVRELRRQLERKKSYPLAAKRMGHQGRVVVRFVLERTGQVKSAEIVQASNSKFLNDAAEDLIRRLDGLEPFPVQLSKSEWAFQVPIDYHM